MIKSRFDLNGIIIDGTAEGGRIFLMKEAASLFTMNYVTFLFGYGFYLTNPHNEYFKVFINSGTISGLLFLTYLLLFYFKLKKNSINKTNTFLIVLTPIIVAMTTYGHVMLFWLAFGMSWILSFVDLEEQKNTKTLTLSVNYS